MGWKEYESWHFVNDCMNCLMSAFFLAFCIYGFKTGSRKINATMKWVTIAYIGFYFFLYFQYVVFFIIWYANGYSYSWTSWNFSNFCSYIGFIGGHSLFYILMFVRLHGAFHKSALALSQLCTLLYILGIASIVGIDICYFTFKFQDEDNKATDVDSRRTDHMLIALTVLDMVIGVCLIWSFTRRLFILITMDKPQDLRHNATLMTPRGIHKVDLSEVQQEWLSTIARYSYLCSIAIANTNFHYLMWAIVGLTAGIPAYSTEKLILKFHYSVVLFINMAAVYLSFSFANDSYYRFCGFCHKGCLNVCEWITAFKMFKQAKNEDYRSL